MKRLIYYILLVAAVVLHSCDDSDDPVIPGLSLKLGVVSVNSATFTVTSTDAEKGAWLCLRADESKPTVAQVWEKGKEFDVSKTVQCTVSDLQPATNYVVYVVVKNGLMVQSANLAFTTAKSYKEDVAATYARGYYFGDFAGDGSGYYMVALSQEEISEDGLPTGAGQHLFRLFIGGEKSEDSNAAQLSPGDFVLSDGYGKGTFNATNSDYIYAETDSTGPDYKFLEGSVHVERTQAGEYTIEAELQLDSEGLPLVRCSYTGSIGFSNYDAASYVPLEKDVDVEPTGWSGNYTMSSTGVYGNYSMALYNVILDPEGFIIGKGDLVNLELLTPPSEHMNLDLLPGTYAIANGNYQPYTFVEGMYVNLYGNYIPMGCYYQRYNDNGEGLELGLSTGGTVTVTKLDATNFKFDIDLIAETGVHIRSSFSGPPNITDYTLGSSANKSFGRFDATKTNVRQKVMLKGWEFKH